MYELGQNIFWAILTEFLFVILAVILKGDTKDGKRKMIIVLVVGTFFAGIVGFWRPIFAPEASNPSHPTDALYFNEHYYKVFIYPSSIEGYVASKSYATTTCNNLQGYPTVVDANSSEQEFVGKLSYLSIEAHPNSSHFVCEWDD